MKLAGNGEFGMVGGMRKGSNRTTTYQVHPVSCTGDETDVADSVKCTQLIKLQTLVHEVNGHKLHSAKTSVDSANELVDRGPQVLILFDILPGRHSQLNHHNLNPRACQR